MILEDFSNKDSIEVIENEDIDDIFLSNKDNDQNIDFTVDNNNNLVISLNLTKNIIGNIKKKFSCKIRISIIKGVLFINIR